MAINNNLQVAAAQVRKGMEDVRQEISNLTKQLEEERRLTGQKINSIKAEVGQDQTRLIQTASNKANDIYKAEQLRDITRRNNQVDRLKNTLNQRNAQLQNDIQARQSALDKLESEARTLEQQAASGGVI